MFQSLKIDLSWKEGDLNTLLPIALLIIPFLIFWFISKSEKVRNYFYRKSEADEATLRHITFNRVFGFLMLGVVPGIICLIFLPEYSLADLGLTFKPETTLLSVISIIVLALLVVPMTWSNAGKPENLVNYPQIRSKIWTSRTIIINAAGWALYLAGYEFLFRGILLFPLVHHLGIWTAVAINTSLYSATHIPKGFREAIGAIPLGVVFCLLTYMTGTLWIAFFVHLSIALTNSFVALKYHPDMKVQ